VERYVQGTVTILSLVNPVICAALFSQAVAGKSIREKIADATRAAVSVMAILCLAAVGGAQLLKVFGISLDVFQTAGGMVLVWMGFLMLRGTSPPWPGGGQRLSPRRQNNEKDTRILDR
jgi:multiple antibiotic resistance protein